MREGTLKSGNPGVPGDVRASCQIVAPLADVPLFALTFETGRSPSVPTPSPTARTRPKLSISGVTWG